MDILIPDNWLRDRLKTKATPRQIAEYLSLCGPSIERINETPFGAVYSIEVTTNRVDCASVYGVAREASAILPRFKIPARLTPVKSAPFSFADKVDYLHPEVDYNLCQRFTCVLVKNVQIKDSPRWMKERLAATGERALNNVVDISNYIMHELGQPVHTFDYDKIKGAKMILRESKKLARAGEGEKITTLDGKTFSLPGGDIVIEDGEGRLIDLAGIMGGENSAVDENTKNVLLFVQTYNPVNIRRTSMALAHRTEAAVLFEKGLDPELVRMGILRGIGLFTKLTGGTPEKKILDLYPQPYKPKKIITTLDFIESRIGVSLAKPEISKFLTSLGFESVWKGKNLEVVVPSFRANDVSIPEDIVEEVARIYGYYNLSSVLMTGKIPDPLVNSPFGFEQKIKNLLAGWGAVEVYNLSLVSKEEAGQGALRIKNPLGPDSEYLRTSLAPSLIRAGKENSGTKDAFHLFEVANIYLAVKGNLPDEKMTLAGIFSNTSFREAKGIVEALLTKLNIPATFETEDSNDFLPSRRLVIKKGITALGQLGILTSGDYIYYEFDVETLRKESPPLPKYKPQGKYPAQIEDMTFTFPEKTKIGEVINVTRNTKFVIRVELTDIYKDSYTFRLWYQNPEKTLTDKEVEKIRNIVLSEVRTRFGGILKA